MPNRNAVLATRCTRAPRRALAFAIATALVMGTAIPTDAAARTPAPSQAVKAAKTVRLGDRMLTVGMKGSDVRALQRLLAKRGFSASADGQFGPRTALWGQPL